MHSENLGSAVTLARQDDAGKAEDGDFGSPAALQNAGTFADGGARGQHIIHQHDARAVQPVGPTRMNRKGAADIAPAGQAGLAALCFGCALPEQHIDPGRHPRQARQGARQFRRLIVAPREQARPCQRDGYDPIRFRQDGLADAHQPAREGRYRFQPIAMFQVQHQMPALGRIGENGARPIKAGRGGEAAGTSIAAAGQFERMATLDAAGLAEEIRPAETGGAERLGIGYRLAATQAGRRQDKVQRRAGRAFPSQ